MQQEKLKIRHLSSLKTRNVRNRKIYRTRMTAFRTEQHLRLEWLLQFRNALCTPYGIGGLCEFKSHDQLTRKVSSEIAGDPVVKHLQNSIAFQPSIRLHQLGAEHSRSSARHVESKAVVRPNLRHCTCSPEVLHNVSARIRETQISQHKFDNLERKAQMV